jgi:predicted permease
MPVASTLALFSLRYEENPEAHFESAGAVFCSTVLSAATIPLWSWALSFLK